MRTRYRLGVDAGGTFTDFVLADREGGVRLYKSPSTPHDPTEAISKAMADANMTADDVDGMLSYSGADSTFSPFIAIARAVCCLCQATNASVEE